MTWLARIASIASLSNGFAQASTFINPAAGSGLPRVLLIALPLLFFTWINVVGVKHGARLAVGLTIAKVVPLTLIYTLVQLVALGTLPDLAARAEGAPLADAAVLLIGGWAGLMMTLGAEQERYAQDQREDRNRRTARQHESIVATWKFFKRNKE